MKKHPITKGVEERSHKGHHWRVGYQTGYDEASKAFGGCTKCSGKGYATTREFAGTAKKIWALSPYRPCSCNRGKQIEKMMGDIKDSEDKAFLQAAEKLLPDFIEIHYPKGKNKDRGTATVACAQLILWLRKQL